VCLKRAPETVNAKRVASRCRSIRTGSGPLKGALEIGIEPFYQKNASSSVSRPHGGSLSHAAVFRATVNAGTQVRPPPLFSRISLKGLAM
jgi:hypothetical protein